MRRYAVRQTNEYSLADAAAGTALLCLVAWLCFHSAVWMAQDVFPDWRLSRQALLWMYVLAAGTAVLYEIGLAAIPHRLVRGLCQAGVPVVYGMICYRYAKPRQIELEDGACALATQFLAKFNSHLKTSYWIWSGRPQLLRFSLAFWLLVIFLGLLLLAMVVHRRVLLLLLPLVVLAAELMIGYIPQWKGMSFLFTALLFAQADGQSRKQSVLHVSMDKRGRYVRLRYLRWLPTALLAGAAFAVLLASSTLSDATSGWLMERAPKIQAFQREMEQSFSALWRGYFAPQRENITNQTPQYTGREMLQITASDRPAEDVLLRGFCGTDYRNGSWICDTQAFSDACASMGDTQAKAAAELFGKQYRMYEQGMDRSAMLYQFGDTFYGAFGGVNEPIDYTIRHTGMQSRYAFEPYAVSKEAQNSYFIADAQIQKEHRQKEFTYHGWNYFTSSIELTQAVDGPKEGIFQWYDTFARDAYLTVPDRIPSVYAYLDAVEQEYVPSVEEYMEELASDYFLGTQDDRQTEGEEGSSSVWKRRIEHNRAALLELQQEMPLVDDPAWCNIERLMTALALESALEKYQSYSMELEPLPQGEDPIVYFLMQSRKGYCVHFASAAVLFLRELGVPARYVSGYVVRVQDFKLSDGLYTASVKDSSAHAWVEIYLEQIGWVPVDVTPPVPVTANTAGSGSGEGQENQTVQTDTDDTKTDAEDTQTDTDDTQTDTDDTQTDDTKTDAEEEEQAYNGNTHWWDALAQNPVLRKYSFLFVAAGVLLPILLVYGLFRRLLWLWYTKPERDIQSGRYRQAVCQMNRRIYRRLYIRKKIPREQLSDAQYEQILKNVCQQILTEDWTQYMQIVRKAAFAAEEVAAEDARFCCRIYKILFQRMFRGK